MDWSKGGKELSASQVIRDQEPLLPVLKHDFAFRLATTSYIIPAAIMPNLHFLGPYVDEVELVLFESGREDNLPSLGEIKEMRGLAAELDLTYNVHLPADTYLGDPDPSLRRQFRQTLLRFYERTLPLEPEVYILHLDTRMANGESNSNRSLWIQRVAEELNALVQEGMNPQQLALENLEYSPATIFPLAEMFGMGLCLDFGHLLRYGYDLKSQIESHLDKSSMVHLHGVRDGVDHLGLEWISQEDWEVIREALGTYCGGVTLEVFSVNDLAPSLHRMQDLLKKEKQH